MYRYNGEIIHVDGELLSPCRNQTSFRRFLCLFLLSFLHTVYITRIVSVDCHTFVFRSLMKSGTGEQLYDSASRTRLPDLPAFALECLPNRNSLLYGDLYGIQNEASTIFRGTLRYEGMYV